MKKYSSTKIAALIRDAQCRLMLAGRMPDQFLELPENEQNIVYHRALVKSHDPVIFCDWDWDPSDKSNLEIANRDILLQYDHMPDSENGRHIVRAARVVYYTKNHFLVDSPYLERFLNDELHPQRDNDESYLEREHNEMEQVGRADVKQLVQNLTVIVHADTFTKEEALAELRPLLSCENIEFVCLRIIGHGSLDGVDMATQLVIKALASFVSELMKRENGQVKVEKASLDGKESQDLTGYWDEPNEEIRKLFYAGSCENKDIMQMQVEAWTLGTELKLH